MGDFGSDSVTKQLTVNTDRRNTVSDNGVLINDSRRNVGNVTIKGRSQLVQNYGASDDQIAALNERFRTGLDNVADAITGGAGADLPGETAAQDRAAAQITAGGDAAVEDIKTANKLGLGNWLIIGVGALLLLGVGGFVIMRKASK